MAYKFQLGQARLSGSVIQEGDVTADSSQLNASTLDLSDASGIAGAAMEDQSGNLGIAALGVTNAMLAGAIDSDKIAELNKFDTDGLSEGAGNKYFTDARARLAVSADVSANSGRGSLAYNSSTGVFAYEGVTQAEIRGDISVTDAGGDGSLAYNSTSGVITYTGPSAGEVRAHLSSIDTATIDMAFNSGNGQISADVKALSITNGMLSGAIASSKIAELNKFSTTDLAEGSKLYYTQARFDSALAAKDTGDLSEGSNLYYTQARFDSALAAKDTGDVSEGSNLYYTQARFDSALAAKDTGDLSEGSNLYHTEGRARAAVSVSDLGGDGSLSYNNATGVFSFTGPNASEVRAHLSGGEMIDFASGEMAINSSEYSASALLVIAANPSSVRAHFSAVDSNSIDMAFNSGNGQVSADVLVDGDAMQVVAGGVSLKSTIAGNRTFSNDVIVQGDLQVEGALTYLDTVNLAVKDALITVGSGSAAFTADHGVEFGAMNGGWASLKTAADIDDGADTVPGFVFSHAVKASRFYGELAGTIVENIQTLSVAGAIDSDLGTQILLSHSAAQSFSLPAAADMKGLILKIKRIGVAESTITPAGAETIEGGSSIKLESVGAAVSIISDGSNYHVI
jgi:hypothetical protein